MRTLQLHFQMQRDKKSEKQSISGELVILSSFRASTGLPIPNPTICIKRRNIVERKIKQNRNGAILFAYHEIY